EDSDHTRQVCVCARVAACSSIVVYACVCFGFGSFMYHVHCGYCCRVLVFFFLYSFISCLTFFHPGPESYSGYLILFRFVLFYITTKNMFMPHTPVLFVDRF
ncbi:unnamed protein product, partial [Pylaiella littoralis]